MATKFVLSLNWLACTGAALALLSACAEVGSGAQAGPSQLAPGAGDAGVSLPLPDAGPGATGGGALGGGPGGATGGLVVPPGDAATFDAAPPYIEGVVPIWDAASDAGQSDAGPVPSVDTGDENGVNATLKGPFETASYAGPNNLWFDSSTIYYPVNAVPPFPIIALSPSFNVPTEDFLWWGDTMASHGFVLAVLSPTDPLDFAADRADDLQAGIDMLQAENTRSASPLQGKLDPSRAGLMGHSMGGGAVLILLERSGTRYQAGVAMEPWEQPNFTHIAAPTLVLAGESDLVASPNDKAWPFYQQIPANVPKAYAEFAGGHHDGAVDPGPLGDWHEQELHAQWTIAWFKLHLAKDTRYDVLIQNSPDLSRFARAP